MELREPLLEASEPLLEARDPRLLLEDTVRELADRLQRGKKRHILQTRLKQREEEKLRLKLEPRQHLLSWEWRYVVMRVASSSCLSSTLLFSCCRILP